jgi:hypothetical protein
MEANFGLEIFDFFGSCSLVLGFFSKLFSSSPGYSIT